MNELRDLIAVAIRLAWTTPHDPDFGPEHEDEADAVLAALAPILAVAREEIVSWEDEVGYYDGPDDLRVALLAWQPPEPS